MADVSVQTPSSSAAERQMFSVDVYIEGPFDGDAVCDLLRRTKMT